MDRNKTVVTLEWKLNFLTSYNLNQHTDLGTQARVRFRDDFSFGTESGNQVRDRLSGSRQIETQDWLATMNSTQDFETRLRDLLVYIDCFPNDKHIYIERLLVTIIQIFQGGE